MMLGIAARSSTAVPSGRLSMGGHISVRNTAMPKLTGMPMSSAIAEVTSVPKIGASAPKRKVTGFQTLVTKNAGPKALRAGIAPTTSDPMIATSNPRTSMAKSSVVFSNNASCHLLLPRETGGGAATRRSAGAASTEAGRRAVAMLAIITSAVAVEFEAGRARALSIPERFAGLVLDLRLPRFCDLRRQCRRQRHVIEILRELLPVLERPVEELEHLLRVFRLVLSLVDEDEARAGDRPGVLARLAREHL